jgi:hypothetical protein
MQLQLNTLFNKPEGESLRFSPHQPMLPPYEQQSPIYIITQLIKTKATGVQYGGGGSRSATNTPRIINNKLNIK